MVLSSSRNSVNIFTRTDYNSLEKIFLFIAFIRNWDVHKGGGLKVYAPVKMCHYRIIKLFQCYHLKVPEKLILGPPKFRDNSDQLFFFNRSKNIFYPFRSYIVERLFSKIVLSIKKLSFFSKVCLTKLFVQ